MDEEDSERKEQDEKEGGRREIDKEGTERRDGTCSKNNGIWKDEAKKRNHGDMKSKEHQDK